MFLPHEEAARTRMLARLGVRLICVLLGLAFLRDVSAAVLATFAYQWPQPGGIFPTVLDAAWGATWRATPWIIGSGALLLIERPMLRWLVPVPPAGCVRCGYARPNPMGTPSKPCPECGLLEPDSAAARDYAEGPSR